MKKLTSLLLVLLMLIGMLVIPASAADEVSVYLFGEKLEFDVPAQIVNGRTLVPVRKIFEELGYKVDWDNDTRTAIAVSEERTIRITENSYTMYVNDEAKTLDVAPCIIKGRTMVPARAISEASGYKVDWDNDTRSVLITKPVESDNALDKNIVTTIGDYQISEAYYNTAYFVYYAQYSQYEAYYGENWLDADTGYGVTIREMIEENAKTQIERVVTVAAIAKKYYGITLDDVKAETDAEMKDTIESYESREEFDAFLTGIGSTETALETYFGMYAILNLVLEKEAEDGKILSVSDAETEELFNQEYAGKMKVQHILISTQSLDGYTPARSDAEAAAIAYDAIKRLAKGESFEDLIEELNEDPGQTRDSYYVFGAGEMVPEFEEASKKLAVGKYTTTAIKSDYGYHIIKRYPLDKTSEEFKECKTAIIQEKLVDLVIQELEKSDIKWNK